jgi:hypothetical protein
MSTVVLKRITKKLDKIEEFLFCFKSHACHALDYSCFVHSLEIRAIFLV